MTPPPDRGRNDTLARMRARVEREDQNVIPPLPMPGQCVGCGRRVFYNFGSFRWTDQDGKAHHCP